MTQETITVLLIAIGVYMLIGVLVGVPFALIGAKRVDPNAKEAGLAFRFIIVPGSAALWPLVLAMWLGARKGASS